MTVNTNASGESQADKCTSSFWWALLAGVSLVALVVSSIPSAWAASPTGETLAWGETITWEGGPLTGPATIFGLQQGVPHTCESQSDVQTPDCDEFLLHVDIPPSPSPEKARYMEIVLQADDATVQSALAMHLLSPSASFDDVAFYSKPVARVKDPEVGTWRVVAICEDACPGITFTGTATTGEWHLPNAVVHEPGGIPVEETSARGNFFPVGTNAWEPTIGFRPDGSLFYVAAHPSFPLFSQQVLRSHDQGRTWDNVSPRLESTLYRHRLSTPDSFLYVDELTGRVFTSSLTPTQCGQVSFSDPALVSRGEETWTTTAVCGHTDFQNLFAGPAPANAERAVGYPNVVYYCAITGGWSELAGQSTACSKSLDGGETWRPTGEPAFADHVHENRGPGNLGVPGFCGGRSSAGTVGLDGTIYLPRGWCDQPWLAISSDEGATWTRVRVATNGMSLSSFSGLSIPSHASGIAVDADHNLYFTWIAADGLPYLAIRRVGEPTFGDPLMIGPPGLTEAVLPSIDVGSPGRIAISYVGSEDSPGVSVTNPKDRAGARWNGYISISTDALSGAPRFLTAAVNDPADPLQIENVDESPTCGSLRCIGIGDFLDLAIAPDGTAWAAFADACPGGPPEVLEDGCRANVPRGHGFVATLEGAPSLFEDIGEDCDKPGNGPKTDHCPDPFIRRNLE